MKFVWTGQEVSTKEEAIRLATKSGYPNYWAYRDGKPYFMTAKVKRDKRNV